jgi:surface polysaccharide O-acyltransferase-like enzyme
MGKQAIVGGTVDASVALETSRAVPAAAAVPAQAAVRLFFVDNIRVFLTILVILHHLMIIYSGTGRWDYNEGRQDALTGFAGGWFCSVNQAYFMGLFLLISAYFVPGSYDRKGAGRFVMDRLIRLGIPLAVYSWIIDPLFAYARLIVGGGPAVPLWRFFPGQYLREWGPLIGAGPLWFVEVLLIFTLVYVLWRLVFRSPPVASAVDSRFPSNGAIALFALLLAVASFLVRLVFPKDEFVLRALNLQLGFFAQYIALFVVGLIAYRRNWLMGLPDKTGRLWLGIAVLFSLLWLGMKWAGDNGVMSGALVNGGWHWESMTYALWESFLCVSMCIGAIYAFRRYLNHRGKLAGFLVPNAYTAYIIHALVITAVAFFTRDLLPLHPLFKWVVLALVTVPLCFGLSALIRKIPYTDRVL